MIKDKHIYCGKTKNLKLLLVKDLTIIKKPKFVIL